MKRVVRLKQVLPLFAVAFLLLLTGCASSPAQAIYTAPDNSFHISAEGTLNVTHEDGSDTYTWERERAMTGVTMEAFTPDEVAQITPQKIIDTTVDTVTSVFKPESVVKTPTTYRGQPAVLVKGLVSKDGGNDQYFYVFVLFANDHLFRVAINSLDSMSDAEVQAVYDSFSPLP